MTTTDIIKRIDELIAECKQAQEEARDAMRALGERKELK